MRQRANLPGPNGAVGLEARKPRSFRNTLLATIVLAICTLLFVTRELNTSHNDPQTATPKTESDIPSSSSSSSSSSSESVALPSENSKGGIQYGSIEGVLGRLGKKKNLRKVLKESDLCTMCVPKGGVAKPYFCAESKNGGTKNREVHHEGNQIPLEEVPELKEKLPAVFIAIGANLHGVASSAKNGGHSGGQDYVAHCLAQWRLFNPPSESDVYLVVSDAFKSDAAVLQWVKQYQITLVLESELEMTEYWVEYLRTFYVQGYMHPGGSRKEGNKDFNRLVMQRFHVVHALMKQRGLENVVHLENDVLLYARWRDLIEPIVRCQHEISSTFASPKGVIPSVVYIKNADSLGRLLEFVNGILLCGETCLNQTRDTCGHHSESCLWTKKGAQEYSGACQPKFGYTLNTVMKMGVYANDMTYLMNFWQYHGAEYLSPLPAWEHKKGENCVYDLRPNEIYDLASFGQWYSFSPPGPNPRPDKQYVQAMKKDRFLDPTPPPLLVWKEDSQGRKVPFWKDYKLLSMHVHAKNLERFLSA